MTVAERIEALRAEMKKEKVDAYLVPTDDFHCSEYVGGYFKCREYMTGFTGSAGTALIMDGRALMWTDGRYFLQAQSQLKGTGIELMRMGDEGVPTIEQYVGEHLSEGQVLGFDGRCITAGKGDRFSRILRQKGASVRDDLDLVGRIWEDRPALACHPVWELDERWTGKSRRSKIDDLRDEMTRSGAAYHVMTSLDDIAYLLNLRGDDTPCNPVFLAYAAVTPDEVLLFTQKEEFADDPDASAVHGTYGSKLVDELRADGVKIRPYEEVYSFLREVPAGSRLMLDSTTVNYQIWQSVPGSVRKIDRTSPVMRAKAVKTETEMRHMTDVHVKDGVAVTKFMYWLKKQMAADIPLTELGAASKLEEFRRQQEGYLGPSFDTIAGYGAHGAVVHYEPTPETDIPLEPKSFLLVDSGGQYMEGTTDITRTFACGPLTDEEKECYTRVLRGNLNLAAVKFRYGCTGAAFDYIARRPLWEAGQDYNHGTGHGVGYLLNVHEGPNSFSYKVTPGRRQPCVFEEGMVTSDEPGIYITGKFGVRCENLLLCRKDIRNEYGQFMRFDTLTLVPWDLDAVLPAKMTAEERTLLNAYHRTVFEKISPYLSADEAEWLRRATRAL